MKKSYFSTLTKIIPNKVISVVGATRYYFFISMCEFRNLINLFLMTFFPLKFSLNLFIWLHYNINELTLIKFQS